ncbi:hypothetical protein ACK2SD_12625 [Pseudomonas sp. SC11]|uniref:hypothetical protein n=1 Tax=Pseudomonas sp. SC11 TaxID=326927 RepID=UPI00399972D1
MQLHSRRSIFAALFAFAAVCLLASLRHMPHTHPVERRVGSLGLALVGYRQMARNAQALAHILCMGLSFGGMFVFITASPYVYIDYFVWLGSCYG